MLRRITKIAVQRILIVIPGLMLATAGLAALPASQSSAATLTVVSFWGSGGYAPSGGTFNCGTTWDWTQGALAVDEIYNPCNSRVWVHYVNEGDPSEGGTFCVNPGGGLAYAIPLKWVSSDTYSDIQLTSNTSPCDSGDSVSMEWEDGLSFVPKTYACQAGFTATLSGYTVDSLPNVCNFRIWLHSTGTAIDCLNPSGGAIYQQNSPYTELQMTNVEAPCSATQPYKIPPGD
jgi:hypothetical protein